MRLALIVIGFVLLCTTFYLGFLYGSGAKTSAVQPVTFRPYDFSLLGSEEPASELAAFTDKQLGVSFTYPKNYYMNYVPADLKNPRTSLFFSINNDAETILSIDDVVRCEIDNRREAFGMCREGSVGDFGVSLERVSSLPKSDPNCIENKISGKYDKTVFSCLTSNLGGNPESYYDIYIKDSEEFIRMGISTANLYDSKNAIKLIGTSLQPTTQ